ncbi:PTGES2 [Symbiodinium microadriaticum]|nr:PTGES2 [Symbiodinium microadriaticum]
MKRSLLRAAAEPLKLYQYAICPFCNKTKAALDFLKVPYRSVEVDPLTRSQIKFSKDYKKVPIAVMSGGTVVGGSTEIVDAVLESEVSAPQAGVDAKHFLSDEARHWNKWCDEKFAVCVYPNITRSVSECWQALGYLQKCPEFSLPRAVATRALGAIGMAAAHGKIKKKYQMEDEREALFTAVDAWTAEVGGKEFRGGEKPDLSDLAVFGCIRGISDLPLYSEMAEHKAFGPWFGRVANALKAKIAE